MSIDPQDIVLTAKGEILYRGRDLRRDTAAATLRGVNWTCGNVSCGSLNVQCFDDRALPEAINAGFCSTRS